MDLLFGFLLEGAFWMLGELAIDRVTQRRPRIGVSAFVALTGGCVALAALTYVTSLTMLVATTLIAIPVVVVIVDLKTNWPPNRR
jgi:hypothetical protein